VSRVALLADLRDARARLAAALGSLDEARMGELGPGGWRLQDILSHVTAWDVDLLTNLGKVQRGQKAGKTDWRGAEIQAQNEQWQREFYSRPAAAVLADFHGVHQQLVRKVEELSDQDLAAPAAWLQGRSIEDYFRGHVIDHEREHAAELAKWRAEKGR
jgi:uncharacterized damage-inducible protein DinB